MAINTQTLIQPHTIELHLPEPLASDSLRIVQNCNPHVELWQEQDRLLIAEKDFLFDQVGFFTFRPFPEAKDIDEEWLEWLNSQHHFKIETNADGTIIIHMLTTGIIATFTLLIGTVVVLWNREHKKGRIHGESAGYLLPDPSEEGKTMMRAPDVSYIAYDKASKEQQNTWKYREVAPSLCIEVVSAKADTNKELRKMQRDWMASGTEIGLVVDPHAELFYVFEQGKEGFEQCNFSQVFKHQALQGLAIDFEALLNEAKEEEE